MEFYPAHLAYQNVRRMGFRTFIKKNGKVYEPFSDEKLSQTMDIEMNGLSLSETDPESGLKTEVFYYVLPGERIGALVREVTITNLDDRSCVLEVLDGMPAVVPYGISVENLKNMTQTAKAWMMAENLDGKAEMFKLRTCMDDLANVDEVDGVNFAMAIEGDGSSVKGIVDPELIFAYDTGFIKPVAFYSQSSAELRDRKQRRSNIFPCNFFVTRKELQGSESLHLYELYGQAQNREVLEKYLPKPFSQGYFAQKREEAARLTQTLTDVMDTHTGDKDFDAYCRYTYMDNALRGGVPVKLSEHKIFYLYSRKHGDLERDYNDFSMLPEYYSQGNGNFRDVNQNRRCDTFFAPYVGRKNIHTFYGYVQADGYNPLKLEKVTYSVSEEELDKAQIPQEVKADDKVKALLQKPFTPGKLYETLEELLEEEEREQVFRTLLELSEENRNASFGEGFWSDHWDYNLDLIEEYLAIFPEQEKELYRECCYPFYRSPYGILPRRQRYVQTPKGIRQYRFLQPVPQKEGFVEDPDKEGELLQVTLLEKMILLCVLKFAALDEQGMGVEMEGGKPGWYDALNGLPGMLGSSMAETYELLRCFCTVIDVLERYPEKLELLEELGTLIRDLTAICGEYRESGDLHVFWNRRNDSREAYREKVYQGISGRRVEMTAEELVKMLTVFRGITEEGIERARGFGSETVPTYFYYEVQEFEEDEAGINPTRMQVHPVADFLEGPVRYLKLPMSMEKRRALYRKVRNSDLYDKILGMYKVNASLSKESLELGRATAFTPGWLENESIWLHMEYKYLLEMLKNGMYEEFCHDLRQMGVPFQPEERYGRSHLENSSFLASSSNPDPAVWGKGFVARLSGSTVEFLNMWRIMLFGQRPFVMEQGELTLRLAPCIPEYLQDDSGHIEAMFLGCAKTIYHLPGKRNYFPGSYRVGRVELKDIHGGLRVFEENMPTGKEAELLRYGYYKEMNAFIEEVV